MSGYESLKLTVWSLQHRGGTAWPTLHAVVGGDPCPQKRIKVGFRGGFFFFSIALGQAAS